MDRRILAAATASLTLFALGSTDALRTAATATVPAASTPQIPYALLGEFDQGYGLITDLGGPDFGGFTFDDFGDQVYGTDISPSGRTGLITSGHDEVGTIRKVSEHASYPDSLSLAAFGGEGFDGNTPKAYSVAMNENAALVAISGQGVVQLRRAGAHWTVDTRVTSSGQNEDGNPHQPGFIRFPATANKAFRYDAVALSQVPLPNGATLGLAVDRSDRTLQVIEGVGTAKPLVVGHLNADVLKYIGGNTGTSGLRFSPATATRAAISTKNGIAVLDLSDPSHPKVLGQTVISGGTNGLAVGPDGDHVAAVSGARILIYEGLATTKHGSLRFTDSIDPSNETNDLIEAVAFLKNGSLAVLRYGSPGHPSPGHLNLMNVYAGVIKNNISVLGEIEIANEGVINSLSVTPTVGAPKFLPLAASTIQAGDKVKIKLHVTGGVGHFKATVIHGKLPAGLELHKLTISGKTHDKGEVHVKLRAVNQYGGAAFGKVTIKVA